MFLEECFVQVQESLLQHLAVAVFKKMSARFLKFDGVGSKGVVADAFARGLVNFLLAGQRSVPDEAAASREVTKECSC